MYDIIIIGAGPAGLTAGLYASRAKLNTLILEKLSPGGKALLTEKMENYPGFPEGIDGAGLAGRMEKQARHFGAHIALENVTAIDFGKESHTVRTEKKQYEALGLILAMGTEPQRLGAAGEKEFEGKGVSYCGVCDAPLFKGKDVIVVGGGDTALTEVLYISKFVHRVVISHRRAAFRASKALQDRIAAVKNITTQMNSTVDAIRGDKSVKEVLLKDVQSQKTKPIACQGVFIFVGIAPNTAVLKGIALDEQGFIKTDEQMKTSVEGVFAAGDIRAKTLRQIVSACGDGAVAAYSAQHYVEHKKGVGYA